MDTRIQKSMIVTMRLQGLFNINKIQNPNPERWKANSFVGPVLGSFVYQLPGGITLAYDLLLERTIAHWKGIYKEYTCCCWSLIVSIIWLWRSLKTLFRASKRPGKFKTWKLEKKTAKVEDCFSSQWNSGWPPISTWMTHGVCLFPLDYYYNLPFVYMCFPHLVLSSFDLQLFPWFTDLSVNNLFPSNWSLPMELF